MARPRADAKAYKRNGFWQLVRRVPQEYEGVDRRKVVVMTTGIAIVDDPKGIAAKRVVAELDETLFACWRDKKAGRIATAAEAFDKAVKRSRELGFPYRQNHELNKDAEGLVERIETLIERQEGQKKEDVFAVMGAIAKPPIMLSDMIDVFKELNLAECSKRSPKKQLRWDVSRKTALNLFIEIIGGDRAMGDLTFDAVMDVNAHLQKKIADKKIVHDTANKTIGRVAALWRDINRQKRLGLADCFTNTRIRGGDDKKRVAFPVAHVQDKILAAGMFDALNDEARDVIYIVAETGMRPSEVVNLLPEHIVLNHSIPHVNVVADKRVTKTKSAVRAVPLVGVALQAMKRHPEGFPRYYDNADTLEALVSKAFKNRKLFLEKGQTFYSLRHTFENRLQGIRAPEKVVTFLMGHAWHREKYGDVPLEERAYWMEQIKFKSPYGE
jgi:integrase